MVLCALSTSRSREQSTKHNSRSENMRNVWLSNVTDTLFEKFTRCAKVYGLFFLDCTFRILIGWAANFDHMVLSTSLFSLGVQFDGIRGTADGAEEVVMKMRWVQIWSFKICFTKKDTSAWNLDTAKVFLGTQTKTSVPGLETQQGGREGGREGGRDGRTDGRTDGEEGGRDGEEEWEGMGRRGRDSQLVFHSPLCASFRIYLFPAG